MAGTLGEKIKYYRKLKKYSQEMLAEKTKLSKMSIRRYESGERQPGLDALKKIASALDVPLYELMGFDGSIRVNPNKQRPFDIAIQKFQNNEELTYEDEQVITKYFESNQFEQEKEDIKQIAKKAYDYILYKHSYSFASSEEELDKLQDAKQIELEKKRAKPFKLYETEGPPKPFTRPLQGRELPKQKQSPKFDYLDETYFNFIRFKMARREPLTEEEEAYRMFHLSTIFRTDVFAIYYFLLNKEGKSKADEIIDRAIEQIALLTKIPEYQPKLPPDPPEE